MRSHLQNFFETKHNYTLLWEKEAIKPKPKTNEDEYRDSYDLLEEKMVEVPAIMTPMGIMPILNPEQMSKLFKFYTVYTNFPITHAIQEIINKMPGVETLDVFTQYRFKVSIGKLFDERKVREQINKTVLEYLSKNRETRPTDNS